jgi:very-short-patch-repair endonuclease
MSIGTILGRQGGVITREQAMAAGLTAGAVDHRLRLRRWRPLHPRVYLVTGHPVDPEAAVRAAVLWAGAEAVLSGVAAAWWHGMLDTPPATITLSTGSARRIRARPGVTVCRRRVAAAADLAELRGLRLTARPLTVLDAAVELGVAGGPFLDRALSGGSRGGSSLYPALLDAHRRNRGGPGAAGAGRLLAAAAERAAVAARRRLPRILSGAGLRGWRVAWPVAGQIVDVGFPAARVGVEVIGWAELPHAPHPRAPAGWTILRFDWHDVVTQPETVLPAIGAAVGAAAGRDANSPITDRDHPPLG